MDPVAANLPGHRAEVKGPGSSFYGSRAWRAIDVADREGIAAHPT